YMTEPRLTTYPTPLILSTQSPNLKWNAQIFVDQFTIKRQLLVRSRTREDLFMIAPHDLVEEFLWLPEIDQVIYTGSASNRYKDGVYLWDLNSNDVTDLTLGFSGTQQPSDLTHEQNFYI